MKINNPAVKLRVKSLNPANINSTLTSSPLTNLRKTMANPKEKGPKIRKETTEPR